jgi:hypothetical protein
VTLALMLHQQAHLSAEFARAIASRGTDDCVAHLQITSFFVAPDMRSGIVVRTFPC